MFSFLSGLYFRGKLAYAEAFARPPAGVCGVLVITPSRDCGPPTSRWTWAGCDATRRWTSTRPTAAFVCRCSVTRAAWPARRAPRCEIVLLGSVATGKYLEPLLGVLGERLRFPADFVGRGDMSRGGLLLRSVRAARELEYIGVAGAPRRGPRPARLTPSPERPPRARRVTRRAAVRSRGGSAARRGGSARAAARRRRVGRGGLAGLGEPGAEGGVAKVEGAREAIGEVVVEGRARHDEAPRAHRGDRRALPRIGAGRDRSSA